MKLLLYCTKAKPYLRDYRNKAIYNRFVLSPTDRPFTSDDTQPVLNGKIVAECDFEVEEIGLVEIPDYAGTECHTFVYDVYINFETKTLNQDKLFEKSCLNWEEMEKYLYSTNGKGYAIHIKNLNIFDKPRDLEEYEDEWEYPLEKAPQNMRRCYSTLYSNIEADMPIRTDSYILISIRPEWLCKILNGEKTIEVRKKVLKEMK